MSMDNGLPKGWTTARVNELVHLTNGRAFKPDDWKEKGLPIIRIQNLNDPDAKFNYYPGELPAKFLVESGNLLFAWSGTPGTSFGAHIWRGGKAWLNQHIFKVEFDEALIHKRFLQLAINQNLNEYIRAAHGGAGLAHITKGRFEGSELLIPPLPEQRRIVQKIEELFSKLDAGVAALERVKANLKRYRAAVLKAAVEGKLTAEWRAKHPDTEPASQLLERILKERRRKWEEAQLAKYAAAGKDPPKGWREKYREPEGPGANGLPELPKGWCYVTVEQLTERSEYGTSVKCDYGAPGPPVLRIPNIAQGRIDLADLKHATVSVELEDSEALRSGDLLMCRTNGSISLIGKAALVPETLAPPHAFASYLLRFRLVESNILPRWMHTFVSSLPGRRFIERNAASSAGQHNISLSLIHTMPLPFPAIDEQQEIVAEVERRLSIVDELEAQVGADLKRAGRLRQSILKRAFTGRLVPQDPSDEPAAKLLERIRASRSNEKGTGHDGSPARPRGKAAKGRKMKAGLRREGKE